MAVRLLATPGSPFARANTVAIDELARGGAFWYCQFDEQTTHERCGVHPVAGQERSEAGSAYRFSVESPRSGYDASFIVQTATPASPFLYSPAGRRCAVSAAP